MRGRQRQRGEQGGAQVLAEEQGSGHTHSQAPSDCPRTIPACSGSGKLSIAQTSSGRLSIVHSGLSTVADLGPPSPPLPCRPVPVPLPGRPTHSPPIHSTPLSGHHPPLRMGPSHSTPRRGPIFCHFGCPVHMGRGGVEPGRIWDPESGICSLDPPARAHFLAASLRPVHSR